MQGLFDFNTAMIAQYDIFLSLKTPHGFVDYGQYFLGSDRQAAYDLFNSLKGDPDLGGASLHIDLMETVNNLPVKVRSICCNLDELGVNCQLIAKTLFRLKTLKELEND